MNELEMSRKTEKVGASRGQIEDAIDRLKVMKEQIDGNDHRDTSYKTVIAELRDMATGGDAWPIESEIEHEIEHEGGVDEKGPHAPYIEIVDAGIEKWNLRKEYYSQWKNEDFAVVLEALGETLEKSE